MNLRNILILIIIFAILITYFVDLYKNLEKDHIKNKLELNLNEDNQNEYFNPYLINGDANPNIIKKYNDNKISIVNINNGVNKNIYDSPVLSTLNNNTNRNNLFHFINLLI